MNISTKPVTISTVLTIFLVVILTILAELSKLFKDFLQDLLWHHLIAKSLLAIIFFVICYYLFLLLSENAADNGVAKIYYIFFAGIVGTFIILVFYIWHFFF